MFCPGLKIGRNNQIENNVKDMDVERYCGNRAAAFASSKARNSCLQVKGWMDLWCPTSSLPRILA